jgi:NAD-dependent dihydropyrimidine dehydrogenase PreA subunit
MVVAVDWGSCISNGPCMQACPVSVFNGENQASSGNG